MNEKWRRGMEIKRKKKQDRRREFSLMNQEGMKEENHVWEILIK